MEKKHFVGLPTIDPFAYVLMGSAVNLLSNVPKSNVKKVMIASWTRDVWLVLVKIHVSREASVELTLNVALKIVKLFVFVSLVMRVIPKHSVLSQESQHVREILVELTATALTHQLVLNADVNLDVKVMRYKDAHAEKR